MLGLRDRPGLDADRPWRIEMTATDAFFEWFYSGAGGLGGWFIFMLLALGAVIWVFYDTSSRRLPALGWRLGLVLTAALLLPAAVYRLSSVETQVSLSGFVEGIFYLGLLGGLIPPVLAVGYYLTFRGMVACPDGHVYEAELGSCPDPSHQAAAAPAAMFPPPPSAPRPSTFEPRMPPPSAPVSTKPKAHAWLIAQDGRSYQLNQGQTTVGKATRNDISLQGDGTVSREHAKIVEQNGRFRLHDLGSSNGTKVNGRMVREPVLLEPDDKVEFGDNSRLTFVTTRR